MAQASVALRSARTFLNDDLALTWGDPQLFPKLIQAHYELGLELRLNGVEVVLNQSARITVPIGTTNLVTAQLQPLNLIAPQMIAEGRVGEDIEFFTEMLRMTYLPLNDPTSELNYWSWRNESIIFLGATQARDILVRYIGTVLTPQRLSDDMGFAMAELYIGPRIASLAKQSVGLDNRDLEELARMNLDKIMKANVLEDQRPIRRKRYRSRKGFLPGTSIARNF